MTIKHSIRLTISNYAATCVLYLYFIIASKNTLKSNTALIINNLSKEVKMKSSKSTVDPKFDEILHLNEDISIIENEKCNDFQVGVDKTDLNFIAKCFRFQNEGFFELE